MNKINKVAEPMYTQEDVNSCIQFLEKLLEHKEQFAYLTREQKIALMSVAGRISRPDKIEIKRRRKSRLAVLSQTIENHERKVRAATGIRSARQTNVYVAPKQITHEEAQEKLKNLKLINPRACYVCKKEFVDLHFFYDSMCPECAEFNYAKRFQTAPLTGQIALITGSRLKIGYQATLKMLRAGAKVIATTRFPIDSALRYSKEEDFESWQDSLHIYGLDLRHTPSVELFCKFVKQKYSSLDILINNAAQTVRRPPGFYVHLIENEGLSYNEYPQKVKQLLQPFEDCKAQLRTTHSSNSKTDSVPSLSWSRSAPDSGISSSAQLSQIPYTHDQTLSAEEIFPTGQLDGDLQQVDLRKNNSWRLRLGEIPTAELIELQLVNAIAPFVLCNKLLPLMKQENTNQKHIVNVSAMEGKFSRYTKTECHPHTNMAKASLNMLTHTSANELVKYGIYMNAVDTGWVTDEDPAALSKRKQENHDFEPPLDIVDGAARVCDPFFHGILTGNHWSGKFLKDYFPTDW